MPSNPVKNGLELAELNDPRVQAALARIDNMGDEEFASSNAMNQRSPSTLPKR
jgi:hypothetical protein